MSKAAELNGRKARILSGLSVSAQRLLRIDEEREAEREHRDALIREALDLGASLREIGKAAGLSHPRVYKVGTAVTTQSQREISAHEPEQAEG